MHKPGEYYFIEPSPLSHWDEFSRTLRDRLDVGRKEYGDRSFSRDPAELIGEIEQELLDVCGWAFVLWIRLKAAREACERVGPAVDFKYAQEEASCVHIPNRNDSALCGAKQDGIALASDLRQATCSDCILHWSALGGSIP